MAQRVICQKCGKGVAAEKSKSINHLPVCKQCFRKNSKKKGYTGSREVLKTAPANMPKGPGGVNPR